MSFSLETRGLTPESAREISRLREFARVLRREIVLVGARRFAACAALAAAGSLLLDRWLRFGGTTRLALRLGLGAWLVGVLWRHVWRPAREPWSPIDVAAVADARRGTPWLARRVATLLQLEPRLAGAAEERPLIERAVADARRDLAGADHLARIDRAAARRERRRLAGLAGAPLLFALVFPGAAWTWLQRWVLGLDASWPQETYLVVEGLADGALSVPRGEPFELRVRAREGSVVPDEVRLRTKVGGGDETRAVLVRFAENDFRHAFAGVDEDGRLWLAGGDERLGPIPIRVRERPRLEALRLTAALEAAGYREEFDVRGGARDLGFLAGTELVLEGRADQALATVELVGLPEGGGRDATLERPAPDVFRIAWTHRRAAPLALHFTGAETALAAHPVALPIGLRNDRAPRVTLARTGVRDRVTPRARVPCRAIAQDDFGVAGVRLAVASGAWGVGDTFELWNEEAFVAAPAAELAPSREVELEIPLAGLDLEVGAVVQVVAQARDRCHTGAQTGDSRPVVLRIVEPSQLLSEITARLQTARAAFRKAWEEARALEDEMLLASAPRTADWLRRHRLIDRTVWQTSRTLDDALREMTLNALIDEQAEALLRQRALDPLDELAEGELRAQRAAYEADPGADSGAGALPELRRGQRVIVEEMKRVLDGMEQWDSFVDLVNHLNEIIRLQEEARESIRESR